MGGKGMKDSVFLVDFGLARKFINDKSFILYYKLFKKKKFTSPSVKQQLA